jgi:predicted XRE-type DNA-binding protein
MSDDRFPSLRDAIESDPNQAESRKLRSRLMMALRDYISQEGLSQSAAAKPLGVTGPVA